VRGQWQRLDSHKELVGAAALDRDGTHRVPHQLEPGQQRRDVAHALVHDGAQLVRGWKMVK
jgi:ABC-type proline/glycine betaine transport system ATPase subunit